MGRRLKLLGRYLVSKVNIDLPRRLNGAVVVTPVINGMKVGTGGEPWMSGILRELLPNQPGTFYDVGVNLGQTLVKVMTLDPARKYVGFEPNPSCLFYVQRLIERNGWTDAHIVPVCLSEEDGLTELVAGSDVDAGASMVKGIRDASGRKTKIVPVFRYSSIRDGLPDKDGRVGIIKVDVEGAEHEVVSTLSPLIMRDRPVLLVEMLPVRDGADSFRIGRNQALVGRLREMGYSLYRILKSSGHMFAGVARVDSLGVVVDPVLKDYVVIPDEAVGKFEEVLAVSQGTGGRP